MVYRNCGFDSVSSQQFCVRFGTTFPTSCPDCQTSLPEEAQFCGSCWAQVPDSARHNGTVDVDATPLQCPPESFHGGLYGKGLPRPGAKKRGYLVEDTLVGREVAFALIMTEGIYGTGRERIRREARTMGQQSGIVEDEETIAESSGGEDTHGYENKVEGANHERMASGARAPRPETPANVGIEHRQSRDEGVVGVKRVGYLDDSGVVEHKPDGQYGPAHQHGYAYVVPGTDGRCGPWVVP